MSTLETLKSIKARETTVGSVDKKVGDLIEALEAGDEETVLKTLVRSETQHHHDAKKWKKTAFYSLGTSLLLLSCVFGLTVLSIFLAKDVYVSDAGDTGNVRDHPVMMTNNGEVLAVATATKKWALAMAPMLPDHLLKTLNEVTLNTPWNSTLSVNIVAREVVAAGILLETNNEDFIVVAAETGFAFHVKSKQRDPSEKSSVLTYYPKNFPGEIGRLLSLRGRKLVQVIETCGKLQCASFSTKEDEALTNKASARRLAHTLAANIWDGQNCGDTAWGSVFDYSDMKLQIGATSWNNNYFSTSETSQTVPNANNYAVGTTYKLYDDHYTGGAGTTYLEDNPDSVGSCIAISYTQTGGALDAGNTGFDANFMEGVRDCSKICAQNHAVCMTRFERADDCDQREIETCTATQVEHGCEVGKWSKFTTEAQSHGCPYRQMVSRVPNHAHAPCARLIAAYDRECVPPTPQSWDTQTETPCTDWQECVSFDYHIFEKACCLKSALTGGTASFHTGDIIFVASGVVKTNANMHTMDDTFFATSPPPPTPPP